MVDKIKWELTPVADFRSAYKPFITESSDWHTYNNISYNLLYLEFLTNVINRSEIINSALIAMIYKDFIIYSMAIVEAIFANIIKGKNMWPESEWKSIGVQKIDNNKELKLGDNKIKIQSEVFEKVPPYKEDMTLDAMIKKAESKKILNLSEQSYKLLSYFRKKRNKIHIYKVDDGFTDYNSFNEKDYIMMKSLLDEILTNDEIYVKNTYNPYEFLKLSAEEKQILKQKLSEF